MVPEPHRRRGRPAGGTVAHRWWTRLAAGAVGLVLLLAAHRGAPPPAAAGEAGAADPEAHRVATLLARMTPEEKAGQLNLLSGHHAATGPYIKPDLEGAILRGEVGGVYNAYGAAYVRGLQRLAVEGTRLGVPLLIGLDVIHGYRTVFPVPLAQAASFDLEAIEGAERIAAREAAAAGVAWTFAPMLDVARDPRWGRAVEGAGESAWLGAQIAAARVRGFQGGPGGLRGPESVAACAKHFAGYGAVEAGREYNGADLPERALREVHLPPFEAAVRAGAPCVMAAFHALDGVPSTANARLLRGVLRGEWGFAGVTLSDFGAIPELVTHGVAADLAGAAEAAFRAGIDVDMQGEALIRELPGLVRAGRVPAADLDTAAGRVLRLKGELGLLDDPYGRASPEREAAALLAPEHRRAAQSLAERSLVLLKNEAGTLPFDPGALRRLAVIGPLGDAQADMHGPWAGDGKPRDAVTVLAGLRAALPRGVEVRYVKGGTVERSGEGDLVAAAEAARWADAVVLTLGETARLSGEDTSRAHPVLPGDQLALALAALAAGRPTAVVLFAGRPLAIPELDREAPAILLAWFPGTAGGAAVAAALLGAAEPGGRLPMTFPRSVGQVPIYHDHRPTGRPSSDARYTSRYIDEPWTPLYPFGWGLSYTGFAFEPPALDRAVLGPGEAATVSVGVTNTGARHGTALVQLYLRDPVASVSRPVRELRGFARAALAPGERRVVELRVTEADLAFRRADGSWGAEPGEIEVMTGPHALDTRSTRLLYRPAPAAGSGAPPRS